MTPESGSEAAAQRVADILRTRIVKGELPPGGRIVERALSAELAVSRTPIREALKVLQADGLVSISLHRGAQVTLYSAEEAEELFDVIAALEGLAAQRFAERASRAVIAELEAMHATMLSLFSTKDASAYFDVNTEIHDLIVAECGNPALIESHRRLMVRARRGRYLAIMNPARWQQAVNEHEGLMKALRAGDIAACGAVWMEHLRHTGATVADLLRSTETSDTASRATRAP